MKKSAKPAPSSKPRPQRRSASSPRPIPQANPIELPDGMWERIARKAYELYEQRGGQEGRGAGGLARGRSDRDGRDP